jgi:hypothetical protein
VTTDDPLLQAARWCAHLAEVLGDVGRRAAQLGEMVGRDWPDAHGREWAERTSLLGSLLGREAFAAAELGDAYARQAAEAPVPAGPPPIPGMGGIASRRTGARLGGTDAERVDDERGMRIAELGSTPSG